MTKPSKSIARLSILALVAGLAAGTGQVQADPQSGGHEMHGGDGGGMHHGGAMHEGGKHGGEKHGEGMGAMHGGGGHDQGMQGGGMHCKGKHGGGMHGGGKHGGPHLYGGDWQDTLTDVQRGQLDRLHVEYAKTKAPRKALINALKVELTVLATATEPDLQAIDAKIDELLQAKREALRAKYAYIAEQRGVLTADQQVSFDMDMIHKAMHGQKGKGGHH